MAELTDILVSVNPGDDSTGVPLNQRLTIIFNTEIDEVAFAAGALFLEGPDTDQVIYPGYNLVGPITPGSEQEILESPAYAGIVPGTFTFSRLHLTLNSGIEDLDTEGTLDIYRSKVIFTPTNQLVSVTTYTAYLVGDDDDVEGVGVQSRTVFDGEVGVLNSGTGTVEFSGSYTGTVSDVINVRITNSGLAGTAEFEYWKDSAPLTLEGPSLSSLNSTALLNGVTIKFLDGSFVEGDTFSVVVKPAVIYTSTLTFSFTTGTGSITAVPTTTSTSITGDPTLDSTVAFELVTTDPEDGAVNVTVVDARTVVIEFSSDLDATTVTQDSVQVFSQPIIDHPLLSASVPTGEVAKTLTVSGNQIIITL